MIDELQVCPPASPARDDPLVALFSPGTNLELGPTKVFFFFFGVHHFHASHPKSHSVDPVLIVEFCSAALRCSKRRAGPSHNLHQTVLTAPHNPVTQPRGIATVHLVLRTPTHTHTRRRQTRQHAVGSMGAKARTAVGSESMTSRRTRGGEGGKGLNMRLYIRRRALVVSISIDGAETFHDKIENGSRLLEKRRLSLGCKIKPMLPRRIFYVLHLGSPR